MSKVKVAVIGYGHLGKWHCQKAAQLDNCEFIAIVEAFPGGREKAAQEHPNIRVCETVDEVINDVDAFVIVTPTSTHAGLVEKLLSAGKHVFCEKPLCSNTDEIKQIESNLNSYLVLQVGHSERCHQAWEVLKQKFEKLSGQTIVKINRFAPFKGRATDVDVVQDLMIHDIDLMLYLFNKTPKKVKAYGFEIRTEKYDHAVAQFDLGEGSICEITSGRNSTHEVRELEVVSKDGCYRVDLMNNTWAFAPKDQLSDGSFVEEHSYEKRDHLLLEQQYFYNSILNETKPFVDFQDGKKAVEIIDCVIESLNNNKEVEIHG
jgi:predicted dehydrogenase